MIAGAFFALLVSMGLSLGLCLLGCLLTYWLQGMEAALSLFEHWVFRFNGILVGGTTWGMARVIYEHSQSVFNRLMHIIQIDSDDSAGLVREYQKTHSLWRIVGFGLPIGALGAASLLLSGYPLDGFAKWYLAIGSASLHFAAAFILIYLYYTIRFFRLVDANYPSLTIRQDFSPMQVESFNSYFIITATLGIFASYFAFRGTLTAGFLFPVPLLEKLLIYPIIMYVPIGLMYSFYPRYVLKKIYDRSILSQLDHLERARREINSSEGRSIEDRLHLEEILASLREKLTKETRQLPLLDLKDYPSLLMVILMFIQYIWHEDSVIRTFIDGFIP